MCDSFVCTNINKIYIKKESTALQIRSREQRNDQFVNSTGGDCSIAIRQQNKKKERETIHMMRVIVSRTILRRPTSLDKLKQKKI